jgi:PKHD-type hydroxylase
MLHFYPTYVQNIPHYDQTNFYWFQFGFNYAEIKKIEKISKKFPYEDGKIVKENNETDDKLDTGIRKSKIKWLPPEADSTEWIYERLMDMSLDANWNMWGFDLHHIRDAIQYTEYHEDKEGEYKWHQDMGAYPLNYRKISIVVQLSDESEYEGGELQMNPGGNIISVPKGLGTLCFFPSFLLHRVTPLNSGVRLSLVTWFRGANLR